MDWPAAKGVRDGLMQRRLLHVGCGVLSVQKLPHIFRAEDWHEIRLDIDPSVLPDVVSSITDMQASIINSSFDAIWSSHNIEHLYSYEVPAAFREFRRVLKPGGFLLICCPDVYAVASAIVNGQIDELAYISPAGPITPLDMLFGYSKAIAKGNKFMAHHTAFTQDRLARLLLEAGFLEVRTITRSYDLWCFASLDCSNVASCLDELAQFGLNFI